MGIVSLIIAIIAIIMSFFIPIIGLVLGIVSLCLAIAEIKVRNRNGDSKALPISALVLSIISIVEFVLVFTLAFIGIYSSYNDINIGNTTENNVNIQNSSNKLTNGAIGKWYDSTNSLTLEINSDGTMQMYTTDKSTLYIIGNYTLQDQNDESYEEYLMTVSTTNRTVGGVKYTQLYTTKFDLLIDGVNMVMTNTSTYSMYNFTKIS